MLTSMKSLAFLTGILALLAAIWFAVFAGSGFLRIYTEDIDESFYVDEGTTLSIESSFGVLDITTYNGSSIELTGEKKTNFGEGELDRIDIEVETGKEFSIDIDNNDYWWVWFSIDIKIPKFVILEEIDLISGSLEIEDTHGPLDINMKSGDLKITGHSGDLYANCDDGELEVNDLHGNLTVDQNDGRIEADTVSGVVEVNSDTGEIILEDISILGSVRMNAGSLDVHFLNIHQYGSEIISDVGDINVRFPGDINCSLDIKVELGDIRIRNLNIDYTRDEETDKMGTVGEGGPTLRIRLDLGDIEVEGI